MAEKSYPATLPSENSYLVQSKIKADAFQCVDPVNIIGQKDIKDSIFDMVRDAEAFFLKNMKTAVRIEGF